ncbi:30S ribosomal protein S17e [Candidatus Pacearchaeota archaeon CG10_big_fil_rev_8_21_14_0_10_34_12]|jgi:ribosomal protein S17E|nr:MAG: 30S ribosomal protein S17e [Candidatus Pacearchaeota archaeon CG10_big_fil_rev_8_21_14_0_10_34_12]
MGKIKSKMIRRTANRILDKSQDFTDKFEGNKKLLVGTIPSKKIRNQTAGLLARIKTVQKKAKERL